MSEDEDPSLVSELIEEASGGEAQALNPTDLYVQILKETWTQSSQEEL